MAEDGAIDSKYPLKEFDGGYRQRTKKNVEDADGTLIFYRSYLRGGTELTVAFCIKQSMPYKLIDIDLIEASGAEQRVLEFIEAYDIKTLNVAGPRLSGCPEIYGYVRAVIVSVIRGVRENL